jgi:hypothetical protein
MQQAQMGLFRAGSQLGTGLAGLMGFEDPEIAQARQVQGLLGGADMNDPDALMQVAQRIQSINPAAAQELSQRALNMRKTQMEIQSKETDVAAKKSAANREEQLRTELAGLPPDATDAQIEAVLRKYGDPDTLIKSLERRQTAATNAEARMEQARQAHLDRMELARLNNASRADIAAMNRQFQMQITQMRQDMKAQQDANKPQRPLPASLQKAEDADFEAIDTATAVVSDIAPIINNLETGQLNLSRLNRAKMTAQAFVGSSDPEVLRFQELERNLTRFVNESLRLNKGVQTEGDAQRAAQEYQAAYSKNDAKGMTAALKELEKINKRVAENRRKQIDRRRKSQNLPVVFGASQGRTTGPVGEDDLLNQADAILRGGQ